MAQIVFIDANIFLEVALGDKKSAACKRLFADILEGKVQAYTSDFIIYTCLLQIQHHLKDAAVMDNFIVFISSINIQIIRCSLNEMKHALEIMKAYKLDFDDALVVSCMEKNFIKTLFSLDRHFDRIASIKRSEP